MGRKKHRKKVSEQDENSKKKPIKDPDPNSEDYMYDEMDKFHLSKDKILLDASEEKKDESELEENLDEEVLALQGVSSSDEYSDVDEEDKEEENENRDSECGEMSSEDDDEEKELISDKAWGRSKKVFYDADVQDDDIYASDEEAEMAAVEEEKEAMILQKRLAEQLDMEDFYTFCGEVENEVVTEKVTITKDLSKLSKRERLEILAEESPELLPLLDEYKEKFYEVRDKYHPLMLMARKGLIASPTGVKFIEMKHQLLLNYLVNISFYLALKSSKENTKGHPVIDVLVQHRQLFAQMKAFDEKLEPEIEEFLLNYKEVMKEGFTSLKSKNTIEQKSHPKTMDSFKEKSCKLPDEVAEVTKMDPLEYYNLVKAQHEKGKRAKKQKLNDEQDNEAEEGNNEDEGGKRMITYEMSKNKGLIRKRRKELKNPRVKHKMKFRKAIIKRKGQVLDVQREINRYGGETTGIKSVLTRSTKIK